MNFKKILRFTGYTFLGILVALFLFPFLFKDKIVKAFENAMNDELEAEVSFKDVDVSFLRSFPDLYLSVEDFSILGQDTFEGVPLVQAKKLKLDVDIMSLIFGKESPAIDYVGFEDGLINILVLPSGLANYNITKADTTTTTTDTSSFEIMLEKYVLKNTDVNYIDQSMLVYFAMKNVDHTGKGNFASDQFELKTNTVCDSLTIRYDGTTYLKNIKTSLDAIFDIDLTNEKYALKENKLKLNELDLSGEGFVQLMKDDMLLKLDVKTPFEDIRQLWSIIPNAYTQDYAQVKTSGQASLSVLLNGVYNGEKEIFPSFDVGVKVKDGYVLYPGSPFPLEKVNLELQTRAKKPDYSDLALNIPAFQFLVNKEMVSGKLAINNASANQNFVGQIKGKINLEDIQKAIQMESFESLKGIIDMNVAFNALMSHITSENFEKINLQGTALAKNMVIKSLGQPAITVKQIVSTFSPAKLDIAFEELKLGSSNVDIDAQVKNPLAYFTTQKGIESKVNFSADRINLNEWSQSQSNTQTAATATNEFILDKNQERLLKASGIELNGSIGALENGDMVMKDIKINGNIRANTLQIDELSAKVEQSDFKVSGVVQNAFDYMFSNGTLLGDVNIVSKYLDCNMFMSAKATEQAATTETATYAIPERMDIKVNGQFDKLLYTTYQFDNAKGNIHLRNQEAAIEGFTTSAFGGNIGFDGLYETKSNQKPAYSAKLDLSKIKFAEAFRQIDAFKKIVPVAEYIDGIFNTTLVLNGKLNEGMSLDLSSLDASGFIETINSTIKAFPALKELGNKLQIKEIHNIDLTNTRNWFDIVQGVVDIKPFQQSVKGIDMDIAGKHSFETGMDMLIKMKIPRAMLEKSTVTAAANTGLKFLEKEAQKIGLNVDQGDYLFVNVNMTGKLLKPGIKITPVNAAGASAQSAVETKIDEAKGKIKDTIQGEINKQKERVKDTLTKVFNKELDKAKDKIEKESQKVIDDAKDKVVAKIDTMVKGAISDTLKQKTKDILNKNTDIDKIKDKMKDFGPFKKKKG
ncbi:MAG: AsmA-like C-terminal region-containing protein [Saprospiraceae bacterium]